MEDQPDWDAHAPFMTALHEQGFVALAGPLEGTPDVLLIARADSAEQLVAQLTSDPWVHSDLLRLKQVTPWTVRLGSLEADQRR